MIPPKSSRKKRGLANSWFQFSIRWPWQCCDHVLRDRYWMAYRPLVCFFFDRVKRGGLGEEKGDNNVTFLPTRISFCWARRMGVSKKFCDSLMVPKNWLDKYSLQGGASSLYLNQLVGGSSKFFNFYPRKRTHRHRSWKWWNGPPGYSAGYSVERVSPSWLQVPAVELWGCIMGVFRFILSE